MCRCHGQKQGPRVRLCPALSWGANVTRHHVVERGRRAAIGDAVHLRGGHALKQLGGKKDCRARAAVAKSDLAGLLLEQCDQFRNRFGRTLGWTTSASGVRNRSAIGWRSLSVSNGMCLISVGLAASELAGASSV